jgi:Uma2 family endonuclease
MGSLTIELPPRQGQIRFNLRRWEELLADAELARIEGRVETDRYGNIIMSPPPVPSHGSLQFEVGRLLSTFLDEGRVLTECPISTADGVKAADVAWASPHRMRNRGNRKCFILPPEICVEVLSPRNNEAEMLEKMALYFDAGAQEVWLCAPSGEMRFIARNATRSMKSSCLCPTFPKRVLLRT